MPTANNQDTAPVTRSTHVREIVSGELRRELTTLSPETLQRDNDNELVWVDLVQPDHAMLEVLQESYELHPLEVKEVFEQHHTSHVTIFDHSAHLVIHYPQPGEDAVSAGQVQIIIGAGFLVTIHPPDMVDTDDILQQWQRTPKEWRSHSSSLLYAVLRHALTAFDPAADHLTDALEQLQQDVTDPGDQGTPRRNVLYNLFDLIEQIVDLHNMAMPLRDALHSLRHDSDWFSHENSNAYVRAMLDDTETLANRVTMLRDTAQRLFEMVNSLIMMQRTDVSKRLTLVATIFLPLSFLGTYFGQNFEYMTDAVSGPAGFLIWGVAAPVVSLGIIIAVMWKVGGFQ